MSSPTTIHTFVKAARTLCVCAFLARELKLIIVGLQIDSQRKPNQIHSALVLLTLAQAQAMRITIVPAVEKTFFGRAYDIDIKVEKHDDGRAPSKAARSLTETTK